MCRLFALISRKPEKIDYWFFNAKVPFKEFSERVINRGPHNSGWGIAWLEGNNWKLFKEGKESVNKYNFDKVRRVSSSIIMCHLRHASQGDETTRNAHPFIYKNWIFEHNGSVKKEGVINYLEKKFQRILESKTASEIYFLLIMQFLEKEKDVVIAIKKALKIIKKHDYKGLNFILSNGKNVYAYRDANPELKELHDYYCLNFLVKENQIVISSDPLNNEKWQDIRIGEMLMINNRLEIRRVMI